MLSLKSLKDEVRAAGLMERCETRSWGKFFFFLSIVGGLLTAHVLLPLWASILLVPVTGWFSATMAMMGHEGSHRGLSTNAFRNRLMYYLTFPVFGGVSAKYWHWKHDGKHHAYPNVLEVDPDILLWPMASTAIEYRRASPGRQWFQRNMQGMMFWPLCFMLVWSMRGSSVAFLYRHAKNKGMDRAWWLDVGCMMLHATLWVVIPTFFFGLSAIALYAGIWTIVGISLSAVFAPAHIGMPIVQNAEDIWRLQFETTRNLTMPKWLSFFFIGLDYQIEHHIFPKIPHQKLPEVAKITKRWAHENQVPYHEISYVGGLIDVTRFMRTSWQFDPTTVVELPVTETHEINASAA